MRRDLKKPGSLKVRGMTLIEVLVALVLLVLVFVFVAEQMIATSWGQNKAAQRSSNISGANYLLALMHGTDLWAKGAYPATPKDACGNAMTPVSDPTPLSNANWHPMPACNLEPAEMSQVEYQWQETTPTLDSADITIWVRNTVAGRIDQYELHSFTHQVPTVLTLVTPPPSPTATPIPTPTPTPTATPLPTPTPTATPVPTATPIPTATPVPTPTPIPTATPMPTPTPTPMPSPTATPIPTPTPVPTATPSPTPAPTPTPIPI